MHRFAFAAAFVLASSPLGAQDHQHTPGMQHPAAAVPKEGGQAAFTAIAEIVKMLEAIRRMTSSRAVARIRGLGFIGVVALGDHHAPHHLGIANGSMAGMHGH